MISVILTATDDPRPLARLLTALVPAAADGLVREVAVLGAAGVGAEMAADAGADLFDAGAFAEALAAARGPWVAGFPLTGVLILGWMETMAEHLAREPPAPARLVARPSGLGLGRDPEGWLAPKRLAPSAGAVEQDLQRVARRSRRRLRIFDRR
jgi:hypothetical protein